MMLNRLTAALRQSQPAAGTLSAAPMPAGLSSGGIGKAMGSAGIGGTGAPAGVPAAPRPGSLVGKMTGGFGGPLPLAAPPMTPSAGNPMGLVGKLAGAFTGVQGTAQSVPGAGIGRLADSGNQGQLAALLMGQSAPTQLSAGAIQGTPGAAPPIAGGIGKIAGGSWPSVLGGIAPAAPMAQPSSGPGKLMDALRRSMASRTGGL